MANELLIGVKIGAALSGTFQAAFASARGTALKLGQTADELRIKHARLGDVMARAMLHPSRNVGELRRQYERLGQTIDQLHAKQEKLTASMARGEALKAGRADLRGQAIETAGTALALGAPVVQSVRVAASFQDQMRDTAITGEFSSAEEAKLGSAVRDAAVRWNQVQSEVARGTSVLVAGGIQDAKALEKYAPVMAKAATATRASMDDLGSVAIALKDNLKVGEQGFEGALNMLAYAGKRGQFEIRDMAKWLPALSPSFQALGVTGKEAVAEIGAALQIARKGAGSNDEAANNFKNFLQKITSPDTLKDFEKAGIDLKQSMMNLRAQGMTPVQSMLEIITQYMGQKGPEAAGQFQKVMAIKDDKEREAALQRLSEAYKLGELFQDMQAMSFIRPAIANMKEMKDIQQGAKDASEKDLLGADYKKRMETATEQFKAFKIGMTDIGLTIGDALLPPLTEMLQELKPGIKAFGDWAKAHPGVIKGVVGLVAGLLAGKMALIGIRYGINLVQSPLNALSTLVTTVSGKWTLLRAMWQTGHFTSAASGLRTLREGIMAVGRFLQPFGNGVKELVGASRTWISAMSGQLTSSIRGAVTAARTWIITQGAWVRANLLTMSGIRGLVGSMVGPLLGRVHAITAAMQAWAATSWSWVRSNLLTTAGIRGLANSMAGALLGRFQAVTRAMRAWTAASLSWVRTNLLTTAGLRGLAASFGGQLVSGIRTATVAVRAFSLALLTNPIGIAVAVIGGAAFLVYKYWQPIKGFFAGLWQGLRSGLAPLIPAFRQLASVASAAFVPLMPPLRAVWGWLKNIFQQANDTGGAARNLGVAVGQGIANAVMWVGRLVKSVFDLPGKFIRLGGDIVDGLVNGIKTKFGAARDTIVQFGSSIKGWFTSTLGIKSPSRVFMGFGDNIAQGAAIGIGRTASMVAKATAGMALATTTAWGQPALPAPTLGALPAINNTMQMVHQRIVPATPTLLVPRLPTVVPPGSTPERERLAERVKEASTGTPTTGTAGSAPAAMHIVFSPQITLQPGTPKEVQQQVSQAMQLSFAEFERMMKRYEADKKRRSYGGNS
ncbi:phage tail tape measure protein [Vogesella sp. XCS3]|uniref:phage tail tape measure protein n=1 Tax=Vogesella sp. XCS3 TaxID=2877939 RepID=UPI001D0B315C|nr:phage tail tape measure protein [Vogesella sp. XCS3]UDM18415.1 phage tail tape measure protein [Vogesella sp. XCS3]